MTDRVSLYHQMLRHSHDHPYYIWSDGLVTPGTERPTREELIQDFMSIPCRVPTLRKDGLGYEHLGEVTYATREEAERAVSGFAAEPERETV
jgi:hypothetical protein